MNASNVFRMISVRTVYAGLVVAALLTVILGGFLLTRGSAEAATANVATGSPNNRFTPNISTINVGDSVTFTWAAGTHIVDLKNVSPDIAVDSAHRSGTTTPFTKAGTYYYYCSIHATADQATEAHVAANDAMVGKIVVGAAGGSSAPAAGATTGSPTAPRTGGGGPGGGSDLPAALLIFGALAALAGLGGFALSRR